MNKLKSFVCIFGAVLFVLLDLGILFKVMHWAGGSFLLVLSMSAMPVLIVFIAILIALKK